MTYATIAAGALVIMLVVLLALVASRGGLKETLEQEEEPAAGTSPATIFPTAEAAAETHQGFIFGRVTTDDGAIYEGRLRFGGDEEAFWGDHFDGSRDENAWVAHVPLDQLKERRRLEIFGAEVLHWDSQVDLSRPFMARFGDIARIESNGRDLRVTLKSGTLFRLDHFAAHDLGDGVRVWDGKRGAVDLDEKQIRTIDALVTLLDGRQIVLSDIPSAGPGVLRIYVDDGRYGRVLISWGAFDRVDFGPGGMSPAYGDFPAGRQLLATLLPATAAASPAGWSTTSMRVKPPKRSTPPPKASPTTFPSG